MTVAALSYGIRIASKIHVQWPWNGPFRCITQLWWDDVAMTITVLFALAQPSLGRPISTPGLGMDIWTLTPPQITKFIKIFYWGELLYITGLSMVKTSMLLSYLRFFASPRFRKLVWLVIALNTVFMLLYDSLAAFQCIPISYSWKEWDTGQGHVGYCWMKRQPAAWTASGFNIIFDLVVLGMPMPLIWRMDLNQRKKILVILMFGAGVWVSLVSILRLRVMIYYGNTLNPTWDYDWIARWSTIEVDFWVLAACMPGIRNFVKRWAPEAVGESTKGGVESIEPGLYQPQQRSTRRSDTSFVDEYIQNLEYFRIPEMTNAATVRNMRMGMLWSRASVDLDQLEIAGWNVNIGSRLSGCNNPTPPIGDFGVNQTMPIDEAGNAYANATEALPPPTDEESKRKGRVIDWLMPWRRSRNNSSETLSRSSRRSRRSGAKNNTLSTTASNVTRDDHDIPLGSVKTQSVARVNSTVKSFETETTFSGLRSESGMGTKSDATSDMKEFHAK
ncbi:hypothetical protein HII31_08727 [Pseudocercospora fuligena]|uniref:Rhodopsin domain-containing protein n=1 Tax=Pseudocercospora fuligena TaxID=685502 RepID=A0A8H6VKC2_9PEZI|nr:hypothetical protein HII31_08727 [Pseudocercospora fuligena]